ncbi:hypothetical protein V2G26_017679 [Clonostachys chloroleuca]
MSRVGWRKKLPSTQTLGQSVPARATIAGCNYQLKPLLFAHPPVFPLLPATRASVLRNELAVVDLQGCEVWRLVRRRTLSMPPIGPPCLELGIKLHTVT